MLEPKDELLAKELALEAERQSYTTNLKVLSRIKSSFADPQTWLDTPLGEFGGRRPRELLMSGEHKRLLAQLPTPNSWRTGLDDEEVVVS